MKHNDAYRIGVLTPFDTPRVLKGNSGPFLTAFVFNSIATTWLSQPAG